MAAWMRCEACRKVLPEEAFDGDSATCRSCLTAPPVKPRTTKASPVRTIRPAMTPAAPVERRPLLGVVGSGDMEVRERRAKRAALEQLAEAHAEEYDQLLQAARQVEGFRSS